jgi:hypothetical protein
VQDVHHENLSHHVFGAALQRGLKNHLEQAGLHVGEQN